MDDRDIDAGIRPMLARTSDFREIETDFHEWVALRVVEHRVLPQDIVNFLCDPDAIAAASFDERVARVQSAYRARFPRKEEDFPRVEVASRFIDLALMLAWFDRSIRQASDQGLPSDYWSSPDLDKRFIKIEASFYALVGALAVLQAIQDTAVHRVGVAASRRRSIGMQTKEKVMHAATKYRGRLPKEQASTRIGQEVNVSPARVRKLLSELYPKDEWKPSE